MTVNCTRMPVNSAWDMAPALLQPSRSGALVDVVPAQSSTTIAASAPPSATGLLAGGYNLTVNLTFHNADGSVTSGSVSAATLLQSGSVVTWAQTSHATEYDVSTAVDGGKLKVEFYVTAYADGTVSSDVEFDNGWMFQSGKSNLDYDVTMVQNGQQVYSASGVQNYLYSTWHHVVGTTQPPAVTLSALETAGAVPNYDPLLGVDPNTISGNYAALNATNTAPVTGTALMDSYMPDVGGRDDIGPQTAWTAEYLMSPNAQSQAVMLATADAAGGVPWHFTDESTGAPVSVIAYPSFWEDPRSSLTPANGWPNSTYDPWSTDSAHMPDIAYVAYLATGDHYYLNELQMEANFALASTAPGWGNQYLIDNQYPAGFVLDGANQIRAEAWDLREVAEAASATPGSSPLKGYFTQQLGVNLQALVQQYLVDKIDAKYGQIQGFVGLNPGGGWGVAPWQEGYVVTALAAVAGMNLGTASTQAVQMLNYMEPFIAGFYTNGDNGFNPLNGPAYWLSVADPTTGTPYTTWADFYNGNVAAGNMPANPTTFAPLNYPTDTQGGYPEIAAAAIADLITYTGAAQAYQAYGYVMTETAQAFGSTANMLAGYQSNPDWAIVPKLSDGSLLSMTQFHIDTSASNSVTLAGGAADSLLSVYGSGTDTLNGGTGKVDLMYGGSGADTFNPGAGNDFVFGGSGTNAYNDNTGNDYYQAAGGGNVWWFGDNRSGHDTIARFNPARDTLRVAANLNGNGITTTSQLIAGATLSNGNTILHLSPQDDITLLNLSNPTSLATALLVA